MKLIACMLVRNEDWIIGASLDAALRWVDGVAILLDRCTDRTEEIVRSMLSRGTHCISCVDAGEYWQEMDLRQSNLEDARALGATHIAIIDADEILTANNLPLVRSWFEALEPKQCLDVPMIPMRTLTGRQNDGSVWTRARLTIGFRDDPALAFRRGRGGYQHHNRPPTGASPTRYNPPCEGGAMHLQFANQRRLVAKHVLYRMTDHLRWPGMLTVDRLNRKYDEALAAPQQTDPVPESWWGAYHRSAIVLDGVPWHEAEIAALIRRHGIGAFSGLDLKHYAASPITA